MPKGPPANDPSSELHEEVVEHEGIEAYDDLSGARLCPELMRQARQEEIAYFKAMKVYEKVSLEEAWRVTGKAPIAV